MNPVGLAIYTAARSVRLALDSGIPNSRVAEHRSFQLAKYGGRRDYGTRIMKTLAEAMQYLKFDVTEEQYNAGRFLEARGQRFCCEFGISNAVEKAQEIIDLECDVAVMVGSIQ